MRFAIVGNSGSGKSTLARALCAREGLPLLELDAIVWEPEQIAVMREQREIERDLHDFVRLHDRWVVEGCYADLIQLLLEESPESSSELSPELIFLNPGEQVCIEHCRHRPWEPHKYATREAQDSMLANLIAWVQAYYVRDDACSLSAHRVLFDGYAGMKREFGVRVDLLDF